MDVKRNRCFSGPADQKSFSAFNFESAKKAFFWFSLGRTFMNYKYPIAFEQDNLWPIDEEKIKDEILKICFSIGFAENDCIETTFPANNPIEGAHEIVINNSMTPLNNNSFWCEHMQHIFNNPTKDIYDQLVQAVNNLFQEWEKKFKNNTKIHVEYKEAYFVGDNRILTKQAGIRQVKDYANHYKTENLKMAYKSLQEKLDIVKKKFYNILVDENGLDYFGKARNQADLSIQEATLKQVEEIEKGEVKKQRGSKKA